MKNFVNTIFVLVALGAALLAWNWVTLDYMAKLEANKFVEETRLMIDNAVLRGKYRAQFVLPEKDWRSPEYGISEHFELTMIKKPAFDDASDTRLWVYEIKFENSDKATVSKIHEYHYVLTQVDKGNYFFPDWQSKQFLPKKVYEKEMKRKAKKRSKKRTKKKKKKQG